MAQRRYKKTATLEKGSIIFLKGKHVIAKWEVSDVIDGKAYMFMHGDVRKEYVHPITEYVVSEPLFRKGLRAYPYSLGYENRWKGFEARKELLILFKRMDALRARIPNLRHEAKILNSVALLKRFIEEMKQTLKRKDKI